MHFTSSKEKQKKKETLWDNKSKVEGEIVEVKVLIDITPITAVGVLLMP